MSNRQVNRPHLERGELWMNDANKRIVGIPLLGETVGAEPHGLEDRRVERPSHHDAHAVDCDLGYRHDVLGLPTP